MSNRDSDLFALKTTIDFYLKNKYHTPHSNLRPASQEQLEKVGRADATVNSFFDNEQTSDDYDQGRHTI
jgi:hypothetical protein